MSFSPCKKFINFIGKERSDIKLTENLDKWENDNQLLKRQAPNKDVFTNIRILRSH